MEFCDQIKLVPARLVLQNGEVYEGYRPRGAKKTLLAKWFLQPA